MKREVFVLTALLLFAAVPALSRPPKEPTNVSDLMKKKLKHAQKVLEGVAVKDFDLITKNAEELILISNEAEWKVLKTPRYEVYSSDFRRSARNLVENARKKNIDAAALSYVELTLTCVKCHKHVREIRMTGAE